MAACWKVVARGRESEIALQPPLATYERRRVCRQKIALQLRRKTLISPDRRAARELRQQSSERAELLGQ